MKKADCVHTGRWGREGVVYDSGDVKWKDCVCYLTNPKGDHDEDNKHKQFKVKIKLPLF